MAETKITYEQEIHLDLPSDIAFDAVIVAVAPVPSTGGCIIYGWNAQGNLQPVQIQGPHPELRLPFVSSQIFVKHISGATHVHVQARGFSDRRGRDPNPAAGKLQ